MDVPIENAIEGSKIWEDKEYTISNLPEALKGAILFPLSFEVKGAEISINSNKNAKVYIALSNSNDDSVSQALKDDGWKSEAWFLEYKGEETSPNVVKTEKLEKVFSKNINANDTLTLKPDIVQFAIFMKEGKFWLINFFVHRRNIIPLYIFPLPAKLLK